MDKATSPALVTDVPAAARSATSPHGPTTPPPSPPACSDSQQRVRERERALEYGFDLEAALAASAKYDPDNDPCSEEAALELAIKRSKVDSGTYSDDVAALQMASERSMLPRCVAPPGSNPLDRLPQAADVIRAAGPAASVGGASTSQDAALAVAPASVVPYFEPMSTPESVDLYDSDY